MASAHRNEQLLGQEASQALDDSAANLLQEHLCSTQHEQQASTAGGSSHKVCVEGWLHCRGMSTSEMLLEAVLSAETAFYSACWASLAALPVPRASRHQHIR